MVENECHPAVVDPRSPSVGITRTPVREVMRGTSRVNGTFISAYLTCTVQ